MVLPGRQQFGIAWPLPTHWRQSSCREKGCTRYEMGFRTLLDESVPRMKDYADWIRHNSGMTFVERKESDMTVFEFPAGQDCFEGRAGRHKVKLDRPEVLTQATARGVRRFDKGVDFNECMNEEMYQVEQLLQRR